MSKPKCRYCGRTEKQLDKRERLYGIGEGRIYCSPCVVALVNDAEVAEANRLLDAYVEVAQRHHAHHVVINLDCPFCAI